MFVRLFHIERADGLNGILRSLCMTTAAFFQPMPNSQRNPFIIGGVAIDKGVGRGQKLRAMEGRSFR